MDWSDGRFDMATAVVAATVLLLSGCSLTSIDSRASSTPSATASSLAHTTTTGMPSAAVIGDSIAIGWNVPADDAWPLIAPTASAGT